MSILIIDNKDSFTYNLVQLIEECGFNDFSIIDTDSLVIDSIEAYKKILISPGPGIPDDSPKLKEVIGKYHKTKSILGICLGQQAIAEYFGATLFNLSKPFHGIKSEINAIDTDCYLFSGLPKCFDAGRYHSWAVSYDKIPSEILVTAVSNDGIIMGISHKTYDVHGIQFHPESIMTPYGMKIMANWLEAD